MSGKALEWAFNQFPYLQDASEKLVLARFAWRADDNRQCWPGHDVTAADLNICRRSVQRAVKNLQKLGLIKVQSRPNTTCMFVLNLNFALSAGDTMSPTSNANSDLAVTPSRPVDDTMSPARMTPCHPNKQLNQTLNKQQQQAVVVLQNLVWSMPLSDSEKKACESLLAASNFPVQIQQKFVDEMCGNGRRESIRNALAWLNNMLARYRKQGFKFGYADQVAAVRAGREEQERRESLTIPPLPTMPAPPKKLSEIGRKELAAMGKHPKLVPACHKSVTT